MVVTNTIDTIDSIINQQAESFPLFLRKLREIQLDGGVSKCPSA
jgi:hypothetical protein